MKVKILHIPSGSITPDTYDSIFAKQIMHFIFITPDLEYDVPKPYRKPIHDVCGLVKGRNHWDTTVENVRHYHMREEFELVYL